LILSQAEVEKILKQRRVLSVLDLPNLRRQLELAIEDGKTDEAEQIAVQIQQLERSLAEKGKEGNPYVSTQVHYFLLQISTCCACTGSFLFKTLTL
jgi:hypothetical protein